MAIRPITQVLALCDCISCMAQQRKIVGNEKEREQKSVNWVSFDCDSHLITCDTFGDSYVGGAIDVAMLMGVMTFKKGLQRPPVDII